MPQEGWTDEQMCRFFNVPIATVRKWKKASKREQELYASSWKPVPHGLGNFLGKRLDHIRNHR